jgi:alpha-glucoside transport system permease protein
MTTETKDEGTTLAPAPHGTSGQQGRFNPGRTGLGLLGMVVTAWALTNLFLAFGYYPEKFGSKIVIAVVALVAGVVGAAVFFWFLNMFIEGLPSRTSIALMPYAYVLPALALIGLMLIYPTIQSINYAFANSDSTAYVGLQNFQDLFNDDQFWISIVNNALWLLVVPAVTVALGVVMAVLADKLSQGGEKSSKSLVFMPMAISFVGASAVWNLIYAYDPGETQTGLLNAVWTSLGGQAQAWLSISTLRFNSFLMMVILIWLQVGFAMILLSSAIKGVPEETLEAARIDGANEWKIFWQVVIPQVKGTIITVFVTVTILVLKVFDIVYVLKNGLDKTNVLVVMFFNELFANDEAGLASAIVVILLILVLPILVYQVRHFRAEEANR